MRYGADDHVNDSYRDAGEIRWFLYWPEAPYWPDSAEAAGVLMAACIQQLDRWGVTKVCADGTLPVPGVYRVPEQWPHVRTVYERAGFVAEGPTEIVYVARVDELPRTGESPLDGLVIRRSVGVNGTRLSAVLGDNVAGFIEVETQEDWGRLPRLGGLADIGNLHITKEYRRRGMATWLVGQAAEWLRLAQVGRVLDYASPEQQECSAFLQSVGFRELTRTQRGWVRSGCS